MSEQTGPGAEGSLEVADRPAEPSAPGHRYRHPGDVLRLITSALVVLVTISACWVLGRSLLGPQAVVPGVQTDSVLGRLLVGLAQVITIVTPLVVIVVLVAVRRYRLLVSLLGAAAVAAGAWIALTGLLAAGRPAELLANRETEAFIAGATFPGGSWLAGAAAATVLGAPWLNAAWRRVPWLAVGLVGGTQVVAGVLLPMELVLALVIGWLVGAGFLVAFGAPDRRITEEGITEALAGAGLPVDTLRPAAETGRGSRPFVVTLSDGQQRFVKVLGQDQRDADLLYRGYRLARLRGVGDTAPAASLKQAVERQALGSVMAERAGVQVPHVHEIVEAADGSVLLTMALVSGHSLEHSGPDTITDAQLRALWSEVDRLHGAGIAHRSLRAANVMVDDSDRPWIVDFSFSEVAATDRQLAVADHRGTARRSLGPDEQRQ